MPEHIYFKYYQNVTDDSKNTVKSTVQNFKNKLKNNKNFLNGFTFHVVTSYKDLKPQSELTKYVQKNSEEFFATGGLTTSPVCNKGKKEIIMNVKNYGISSIWNDNENDTNISQAILHEIGHQFDDYFGQCSKYLQKKVSEMSFETSNENDEKIMLEYLRTKDLSDTKEFKSAWKKDAENLDDSSFLNKLFNKLPFEYTPYEIDISDSVTEEEVEQSDNARSEIFAQLFSYAMGEDDGNKDVITEKYPNTYKLVKAYIKKFLGIDCN